MITNIIAVIIILLAVGAAMSHIVKEKKKGIRCIGCPNSGCCSHASKGKVEKCTEKCTEKGCGHKVLK